MGHYWVSLLGILSTHSFIEFGHIVEALLAPPILTADKVTVPTGDYATLTCVSDAEDPSDWRYKWSRRTALQSVGGLFIYDGDRTISVSTGGVYWCRGISDMLQVTAESNPVTVYIIVSNTVVVQPQWKVMCSGETITLTCEIQGDSDTEWDYDWVPPYSNMPVKQNQYRISNAAVSDSGDYQCKGSLRLDPFTSTEWSQAITLTVLEYKPPAKIKAPKRGIIPPGGNLTLSCRVPLSSGWKYYWYKGKTTPEALNTQEAVIHSNGQMTVSQEGLYWCRGGRGEPIFYSQYDKFSVYKHVPNSAVIDQQPNWTQVFEEETITLTCVITDGEDTEWLYEWMSNNSFKPPKQRKISIIVYKYHRGVYRCKGRQKKEQRIITPWSEAHPLKVFDKPQTHLTVCPSWLSPGASVTLSCEVEHPSVGWRFYWYKAIPDLMGNSYTFEPLPGGGDGTREKIFVIHGQTQTAGYACRAGRGPQVYYTQYSTPKFAWSRDYPSSASLTAIPDRVQHFRSESITLSCEGNSGKWRVRRAIEEDNLADDPQCGTGSRCRIHTSSGGNAVYWCESGSGEFSNAVNITTQTKDVILVSPLHPVTEGDCVILRCEWRNTSLLSSVFFSKNGKKIYSETRELNISRFSQSDEGFYACGHVGEVSEESWLAVKPATTSPSTSLLPLFIGLSAGILIIVPILSLFLFNKVKAEFYSPDTNLHLPTDRSVNHDDTELHVYSSLVIDNVSIYESIRDKTDNGGSKKEIDNDELPSTQDKHSNKSSKLDDSMGNFDYYNMDT